MEYRDPYNEWLHTVAHDLKTPINAVRGCIELVQHAGPLNDQQKHFADRAMAGLQRMEHLISRLLDISWVDAEVQLDLVEFNLASVIQEAVDMLKETAERRTITVQVQGDGQNKTMIGDARRMTQVMDNLISNAIKYNQPGGSVIITTAYESDVVKVAVSDSGIGIAQDDQQHVFERFFRAREGVKQKIEGTGLGLAIARGIIEKHRGHIWLESEPDKGTTFFFTLPLEVETTEGDDDYDETTQNLGEGREGWPNFSASLASEERDVVNDNIQENREISQLDSSGDEI